MSERSRISSVFLRSIFSVLPNDFHAKSLFGERKDGHARQPASAARAATDRDPGVGDPVRDLAWPQHSLPREHSEEKLLLRCDLHAWHVFGRGACGAACMACLEADGGAEDGAGRDRARHGRCFLQAWLHLRWSLWLSRACLYSCCRYAAYVASGHPKPCRGMVWRV